MSQPPRPGPSPGNPNAPPGRSRGRASGDAPSQAPGGQQKPPQAVVSRGPPGGPRPGPNAPVGRAGAPGPSRPGPAPVAGGRAMPPTAFSMPPAGRQQGPTRPGPSPQAGVPPPGRARGGPMPQLAAQMGQMQVSGPSSSVTSSSKVGSASSPHTGTQRTQSDVGSGGNSHEVSSGGGLGRGSAMTARGSARPTSYVLQTRPSHIQTKTGSKGIPFNAVTNFFRIKKKPDFNILQYRVDFKPEEDENKIRKLLLRQHDAKMGAYLFDGTMMFCVNRYNDGFTMTSRSENGQTYAITLRLTNEVQPTDFAYIHILNMLLRTIMQNLELTQLGRNYYDPRQRQVVQGYGLECWPGFVTSIRQHENDIMLCVEISTKVLRTDTAYQQLSVLKKSAGSNFKTAAARLLLGNIVITRYNNKTYKVDDIDWDSNPDTPFKFRDGTTTYARYLQERYKIDTKDRKQPLLVSQPTKAMQRQGITQPIKLVPEHCSMTGLSDEQRADFKLMKAVGEFTIQAPPKRIQNLQLFGKRVNSVKAIEDKMDSWKLSLEKDLAQMKGRTLPPEQILCGGGKSSTYKLDNADWGGMFRNLELFGKTSAKCWAVIYAQRNESDVQTFVKALMNYCKQIGFQLGNMKPYPMSQDRPQNYLETVNKALSEQPYNMLMCVIPNNKTDAYSMIKKLCLVQKPVPTQCVTATVLKKWVPKGIQSVASKVAVQMACKLGGEPWALKIPAKGIMVIGYDTWHDASQKGLAVGAVVATVNASLTRYFSTTTLHRNNEENITQIGQCIRKALEAYKQCNGQLPERIFIYRDGVGDGQIPQVKNEELAAIKKILAEAQKEPAIKLSFIIVTKRINNRFFKVDQGNKLVNPPSGSVFDDVVTLPERYDFFLVSQSVRQGTVNPTSYNVIEDTNLYPPDIVQLLTYKLTHLYYNWPGTVRVPMVCQYAHKLAYLVGDSVHQKPHDSLANVLYYL